MSEHSNDTERSVEVVEVAPRDGFQTIAEPLPTEQKINIIEGLLETGFQRLEIGSFVSPKAVPQMADMGEIATHFRNQTDVRLAALVPNRRGADLALEHGVKDLVYVFSASEAHNLRNVRQTFEQSLEQLSAVVASGVGSDDLRLRVAIATSFDCPFTGKVTLECLRHAVDRATRIVPTAEICLCDTTGRANPYQVKTYFTTIMTEFDAPDRDWAFHGHDTFGMGVANALFAYDAGVRKLDGATAGMGGCPFAPGATGNTATEDLVFALEQSGVATGIRIEQLLALADEISRLPDACVGGHLRLVPRERALHP